MFSGWLISHGSGQDRLPVDLYPVRSSSSDSRVSPQHRRRCRPAVPHHAATYFDQVCACMCVRRDDGATNSRVPVAYTRRVTSREHTRGAARVQATRRDDVVKRRRRFRFRRTFDASSLALFPRVSVLYTKLVSSSPRAAHAAS